MKTKLGLLLTVLLLISANKLSAQCNLKQSATTVCAGESVSFWVQNPNSAFDYQFRIEGADVFGDSVVWSFNGQSTDRNAQIRILRRPKGTTGTFQNCCCTPAASIRVKASPDPSLNFLTGKIGLDGVITNCNSSYASPEFTIEVENGSRTPSTNNQYTINWGDGTPVFTSPTFTTTSHTYTSVGYFTLSFTVRGNGADGCREVTRQYTIFNGNDPDISINAPPIKRELCLQEGIRYEITNVNSNVSGTRYEVLLNGQILDTYNHPPPRFYDLTFDKTSCDESYQGVSKSYIFEIRAINPCLTTPVFQTDGPITVGDTLIPEIQIRDTICVNTITEISNITTNFNVMKNCERVRFADWKIFPDTGWVLTSTVPASPLNLVQKEKIRVNFTSVGVYNVRMILKNECRLRDFTDSLDTVIVVIDEPVPDAIVEIGDGCAPDTVVLTNRSTGTINNYRWNITPANGVQFINGTKNTDRDAVVLISRGGNYRITMTVSNKCKSKTWEQTITLIAKPDIELDPITDKCNNFTYVPNLKGDFINATINWTFGGASNLTTFAGPQPPPIIWNNTGNHFVEVTASTSCGTSTMRRDFTIVSLAPPQISNDTTICLKSSPFNLRSSSPGGTWSGAGITNNVLGTFDPGVLSNIGLYKVYYTFSSALCTILDSVLINVVGVFPLSAGPDLTICIDEPPFNLAGNEPSGGHWFGEGIVNVNTGLFNPRAVVSSPTDIGYYYTDLNGCTDTAYRKITIVGPPDLNFPSYNDTICLGDSVFFDLSWFPGLSSLTWDMGDGTVKTGSLVSHTYKTAGKFTVTLIASSAGGCITTLDTTVFVKTRPIINVLFSPREGCGELNVNFDAQVTNASVSGTKFTYQWNFGDGSTSDIRNPTHLYSKAVIGDTTYRFRVLVANECGTASFRDTVDVYKEPFTRFGTSKRSYCANEQVILFNSSSLNAEFYAWDFGNGNTSNVRDPAPQTYPVLNKDSVFTITLTAGNRCGSSTFTQRITIKANLVVAGFQTDPVSGCSPLSVRFINFATTPGSNLIWDLGDGNLAFNRDTIDHLYINPGQYTATLTADNGCRTDIKSQIINVSPSPVINYDFPNRACVGDAVQFNNTSTGAIGYQWTFGDGLGSLLTSPSHTYSSEGVFTIKLIATSLNGCKSERTRLIEVFNKPIAAFDIDNDEICANTLIEIINNSINGTAFQWDFGDNTTSIGFSPLKKYSVPGIYSITLVVSNANTCRDTLEIENAVRIFEVPTADFTFSQPGGNEILGEVQFENLSVGGSIFYWDLGDGTRTSEVNPFHKYERSGYINVLLVAENSFGCTDTIEKRILVEFLGELFMPNAFTPDIGTGETSIFKPKGFGLRSYKIEIYSTYGELLWQSSALENGMPSEGWDGKFKGQPLPQDVYVWKITAVFQNGNTWLGVEDGGKKTNVGTLLLIR